mmetsp:Transcript_85760/g.251092  ORF Transcript_85760/g.251092 Transcript_85760/m.251092 type:complete len:380 (-) Transcript_85760:193-1332(-)
MYSERKPAVGGSHLLLVHWPSRFYLQDLKRVTCSKDTVCIIAALDRGANDPVPHNAADTLYALELFEIAQIASASQDLLWGALVWQQHCSDPAHPGQRELVPEHEGQERGAAAEGVRAAQDLGVEGLQRPGEHVLHLPSLVRVDLLGQQRQQLLVEVLGAPLGGVGAPEALEERVGARRLVHEAQGELQGQARDLRDVVEQHGPVQLAAPSHAGRAGRSHRDGVLHGRVRGTCLFQLLAGRAVLEVLSCSPSHLCKVHLALGVDEELLVVADPALAGGYEPLLGAGRLLSGISKAFQVPLIGRLYLLRGPLPLLQSMGDSSCTRRALSDKRLAQLPAVLNGLRSAFTSWTQNTKALGDLNHELRAKLRVHPLNSDLDEL